MCSNTKIHRRSSECNHFSEHNKTYSYELISDEQFFTFCADRQTQTQRDAAKTNTCFGRMASKQVNIIQSSYIVNIHQEAEDNNIQLAQTVKRVRENTCTYDQDNDDDDRDLDVFPPH